MLYALVIESVDRLNFVIEMIRLSADLYKKGAMSKL